MCICNALTIYFIDNYIPGYPESFQEVSGKFVDSVVSWNAPGTGLLFTVHCYGGRPDKNQFENFQILRDPQATVLDLIDDVTTWLPGTILCVTLLRTARTDIASITLVYYEACTHSIQDKSPFYGNMFFQYNKELT